MQHKRCLLLFALLANAAFLPAQSLEETLQDLASKLPETADVKTTYAQHLTFDAAAPYRLIFTATETAKKDNSEKVERYEINLADLDEDRIQRKATKTLLSVTLETKQNLKTIKFFENGKQENYRSETFIRAGDSENADEIVRLLRQAVPQAQALWEASFEVSLDDLPAMLDWLKAEIGTVRTEGSRREQVFSQGIRTDLARLQTGVVNDKGKSIEVRRFSLADLSEQAVGFKIQGTTVQVEAAMQRKMKLIGVEKDGAKKDYENALEIHCEDPDQASRIAQVLRKAIPLAKDALNNALPVPGSVSESLDWLQKNIQSVTLQKGKAGQKLTGDCQAAFSVENMDGEKRESSIYTFHFGDLDAGKIEWEIKGADIFLALPTR